MPLPPALAARLAKRGILAKKKKSADKESEEKEEVFAENYDGGGGGGGGGGATTASGRTAAQLAGENTATAATKHMGYPGCPNKWNVYHECVPWCLAHWGANGRHAEPEPEYASKHRAMMAVHGQPLPDDWQEHYDPGTGRHFYWCTRTNRVSWLPPGHPLAKITDAASHVREMLQSQAHLVGGGDDDDEEDDGDDDEDEEEEQNMDLDSDMDSNEDDEDREIEERRRSEKERRRKEEERYRARGAKGGASRSKPAAEVDPMDPAAYSDAPRGTWSSGLKADNDNV